MPVQLTESMEKRQYRFACSEWLRTKCGAATRAAVCPRGRKPAARGIACSAAFVLCRSIHCKPCMHLLEDNHLKRKPAAAPTPAPKPKLAGGIQPNVGQYHEIDPTNKQRQVGSCKRD